jgi:acetyl esterase/lipase
MMPHPDTARKRRKRGQNRRWVLGSLATLAVGVVVGLWSLRAIPAHGDEPPPGYSSETLIKFAFATGQLALVDLELPVPDSVEVTHGIQYGEVEGVALHLDLYAPKGMKQPAPALIFIHGGGWKGGKREDYHYYGVRFAEKGYVVATISYRLKKVALFPAAVEDAKCAVRWMRKHAKQWHVDPQRIAIAGGSAGGHLSMMVGYSSDVKDFDGHGGHDGVSSRVQAVVNLYGPVDLTTPYARSHDLVSGYLGKPFDKAPELYKAASPLTYVSRDDPPTLTFHGTLDSLVPVTQADTLVKRLKELNIRAPYERLDGWPHGMDAAQVVNDFCFRRMLAFFDEQLQPPPHRSPSGPAIVIDGKFGDWADVPAHYDPPNDTHDTQQTRKDQTPDYVNHPDVDLLEYRATHDDENLYFYFRSRGEISRTQRSDTGKPAGRYYVIVTIDVDNNDDTGYWVHEGGYFPTTRGYDVNAEIEYYDGAFNTGHYLNHGARNDSELKQAFLDQTTNQYTVGNDGPYPSGFMRVLPGTYDFYTQWVYHTNDTVTVVRDKGPVVNGIVKAALSADRHEVEAVFPLKGFLRDENGEPVIGVPSTIDLSFSLEASGELAPGKRWASDTAEPIVGYRLTPSKPKD